MVVAIAFAPPSRPLGVGTPMRKGVLIVLLVLAAAAAAAAGYYRYGTRTPAPEVTTLPVTRGDVAEVVGATGTLEALTTVQVGTQVSGTVQSLHADFNSIVHKGQVVARLDPSLFETQVAQGRANLVRAQADVERQRVALEDAQAKAKRARELSAQGLVPALELENAEAALGSAQAQLRSAQAQLVQAEASLNQSLVNLQHTVIEAPIDGIVISRNVDVGQTVAASMQAPTLFVIAADLTKMRVAADVDESDVGRIRPGQPVRFRVDAYPNEEFSGTVVQVRLQPKVTQNVVTYATVIDVREKNAWAGGHIAGARHIPLAQLGQRIGELEKLKSKPVIVCCASGVRGAAAGEQLRKAGFEKVFNLNGGIAAWQDAKLPLTTKS